MAPKILTREKGKFFETEFSDGGLVTKIINPKKEINPKTLINLGTDLLVYESPQELLSEINNLNKESDYIYLSPMRFIYTSPTKGIHLVSLTFYKKKS
ncbi:MAG: hypothetical protein AABX88_01200 [Nanoarchaeota archaeon]